MIICVCRKISETDVIDFIVKAPELASCWKTASTHISGRNPVCNNGHGHCHEEGQKLVAELRSSCPEKAPT